MDFTSFGDYFNVLTNFFVQPIWTIVAQLFAIFGWIVFVWLLAFAIVNFYADHMQDTKNTSKWKYMVLAIDIPPENVQTPLAVEQMFAHLAGAFSKPDLRDKFREGYKQRGFSLEIVSIEGYIQFIIRTEEKFRDLVETSVYAQYPDAELTEVEDYVTSVPQTYPNNEYDVWVGDFTLSEDSAYPLRSYRDFEHNISKDTVLKDPMGTFLESFTRIGVGEQMWFQILVEPIDNNWKEKAIEKIKSLIGEKTTPKKNPLSFVTDNFLTKEIGKGISELSAQITGFERGSGDDKPASKEEKNQIKYLTPGQQKILEAMEAKISKIGLKTKLRAVYVARKEVFKKERGVNALMGAINQFNSPTSNSIVLKSSTDVRGKKAVIKKKNDLLKAYVKRKMNVGAKAVVFNIEELATLWHFPMSHVKTPLVQKAETKAAEPPADLPMENILNLPVDKSVQVVNNNSGKRKFTTDSGEEIYLDDFGT
ncbi:MAG: hypothetical protein COU28_02830 [Candidatus Magasanikbacteria bacterium CG10_big_fil_rev_8_21_14_0_10_36_16]|uniref:DUF8128 domain-containing protein n=1 Tax=Candidatus Magasanikbacteria bacterium CG10_big_fil_rev_8_21_14_0_10_36_16 TaxID=1974645 RepID=A0A2H0TYC3_9BACT|nr:MAG: hypothetical protein COU28_02830 [Candidatus Magasanikbacteria bacterium CG10_big_fil_rev_8_21_14_0_10_36_16]